MLVQYSRSHDYVSAMPLLQSASTALQQRPDDTLVQNDLAQSRALLSGQAAPR